VLLMSFALSAALGAIGGVLLTPITLTSYDVGIMLGLKGFVAAVVGGLGSGLGAVVGGLLVGIIEAMAAGYISSAYKDADSLRADPPHPFLHAARPVRRQGSPSECEHGQRTRLLLGWLHRHRGARCAAAGAAQQLLSTTSRSAWRSTR
jgi:hypothetical protein